LGEIRAYPGSLRIWNPEVDKGRYVSGDVPQPHHSPEVGRIGDGAHSGFILETDSSQRSQRPRGTKGYLVSTRTREQGWTARPGVLALIESRKLAGHAL